MDPRYVEHRDNYDEFNEEDTFVTEKWLPEPRLPDLDLPHSELDLTVSFDTILSEGAPSTKPTTTE